MIDICVCQILLFDSFRMNISILSLHSRVLKESIATYWPFAATELTPVNRDANEVGSVYTFLCLGLLFATERAVKINASKIDRYIV